MHTGYGYSEEADRGKLRNLFLLRRLAPYVLPYGRMVVAILLLTLLGTGFELVPPYLTKVAIDRYILPTFHRVSLDKRSLVESPELLHHYEALLKDRRYLSNQEIRKIDPAHLRLLKQAGVIGEERYYRCRDSEMTEALAARFPGKFDPVGGYSYIDYGSFDELPASEIRDLRKDDFRGVSIVALLFLTALGFSFLSHYGSIYALEWTSHNIMQDMRVELFAHLTRQGVPFFDRNQVGRLVTRATNDVQNLNELFKSVILAVFKDVFVIAGVVFVLYRLNSSLAMVCFTLIPFILILTLLFAWLAREAFREIRVQVAKLNGFFQESFANMTVIQLFVRELHRLSLFENVNQDNFRAGMRQITIFAVFLPAIELLAALAVALVIWYGGGEVVRERISLGVLVAFIGYVQLFFRPIREISEKFNIMQSALASTERIFQLLDHDESPRRRGKEHGPDRLRGHVVFREVHFAYREGEPVLEDINFEALPGETVALVGATGAGKTTLIHLLERFYEPSRGNILIDDVDLRDWDLERLRRSIGLVMQDTVLFSGSVLDNMRMDREELSTDEVRDLMRRIQADDLFAALPGGYDHEVGEGGAVLSVGERQLIAFARVLVHDPEILILDEATAHVDPQTERVIQEAMSRLIKGRTTFVIAHRLSTIRHADRILVMRKGRIVESGKHDELMAFGGLYYDLNRYREAQ